MPDKRVIAVAVLAIILIAEIFVLWIIPMSHHGSTEHGCPRGFHETPMQLNGESVTACLRNHRKEQLQ